MSMRHLKILTASVKWIGLLPFAVEFHPIRAKPSRRAIIYSLVHTCIFGPLSTLTVAILIWWNHTQAADQQSTLIFTLSLARIIGTLRTYTVYFVQLRKRNDIIAMINDAVSIREQFQSTYSSMSKAPFLDRKCRRFVHWKVGSLVLQLLFVGGCLYMKMLGEESDNAAVPFAVKLIYSLGTDFVTLVYSDIYFCVTVMALQFFRSINARLTETVAVVRELLLCRRQADAKVQLHCNITDDIDRIEMLYSRVADNVLQANAIFAVPLVLTLINTFLYTLVSLYSLVHDVGKLVEFETGGHPPLVWYNFFNLAYYSMEIYFMVWVSDAVIEEANKTGRILCRTASFQIDKKTKECIEIFSLGILQGEPLMVTCGMFVLDKTLVYGMVGALTSYLTILIQFDLAGNVHPRSNTSINTTALPQT